MAKKRRAVRVKNFKLPNKLPKEIIGIALLALLLGGIYFSNNPISLRTGSNVATNSVQAVELGDFPVYPGATFLDRSTAPACKEGEDRLQTSCEATFYNWETGDSLEQIEKYYSGENIAGSSWNCTEPGTGITEQDNVRRFGKPCLKGGKVWGIGASITKTAENPNPKTIIHLTAN